MITLGLFSGAILTLIPPVITMSEYGLPVRSLPRSITNRLRPLLSDVSIALESGSYWRGAKSVISKHTCETYPSRERGPVQSKRYIIRFFIASY